jgi:hypothetical protein
MIKSSPVKLNRDTLRKLNAGQLSRAQGGHYNSSAAGCSCSSQFGTTGGTIGDTICTDSGGTDNCVVYTDACRTADC